MSPLWTAIALAEATGGALCGSWTAAGISIDTRSLREGDLFVALRGDQADGHAHVAAALESGAAGAMVHTHPAGVAADRLLQVADTAAGLTALGAAGRRRYGGPVIAVTGSVGKTTTKDMLALCLSQDGAAHAAEASHNNHWGVPLTLARLPPQAAAAIVEIGMNHAGEIAPLSRLVRPTVAVITAIAATHIGHLGSLEAIADEKATIGAGLADGGTVVLPADAPLLPRLLAGIGPLPRVLRFGTGPECDAVLLSVRQTAHGSDIQARIGGRAVSFHLGAPGRHMACNAVAALAATHAAGLDVQAAAALLSLFRAGAGRGAQRTIPVPGGSIALLDESYNASAASIRAALAVLALQPARRRMVVLGDMRELGAHSAAEHRGLAADVTAVADVVFTCGSEMRALHEALPAKLRGGHALKAENLAAMVACAVQPGDVVLVKGSHGSRMRLVIEALDNDAHGVAA